MLNNYWRPCLAITGQESIPLLENAANATLKEITFKCSMRLPPTLAPEDAKKKLTDVVNQFKNDGGYDYTYGAQIELNISDAAAGFASPKIPDDINEKFVQATIDVFGNQPISLGCGGSIPFMEIFGGHFPQASFLLTGCVF
mmetsp:Transcript_36049/g.35026  ORF Transcript_36049/g.35026 Transcript_36049/m.35026 type:complete len:142 (+) Transcript_36049:935-1360(+)